MDADAEEATETLVDTYVPPEAEVLTFADVDDDEDDL